MTVEKPTVHDLADKVALARTHLTDAANHLLDVQAELSELAPQMPLLSEMSDLDGVVASIRTHDWALRHCIRQLGGAS